MMNNTILPAEVVQPTDNTLDELREKRRVSLEKARAAKRNNELWRMIDFVGIAKVYQDRIMFRLWPDHAHE